MHTLMWGPCLHLLWTLLKVRLDQMSPRVPLWLQLDHNPMDFGHSFPGEKDQSVM